MSDIAGYGSAAKLNVPEEGDAGPDEIVLGSDSRLGGGAGGPAAWAEITGKPATFPPDAHDHDSRYYTEAEVDALLAGAGGGTLPTPVVVPLIGLTLTLTNMAAADGEVANLYRTKVDLTDATECRLVVRVGVQGSANADLRVQYSTNESAWSNLTPEAAINAVGTVVTAWAAVPAGARGDVFLRVMGKEGDGAADPQIRLVQLQVR